METKIENMEIIEVRPDLFVLPMDKTTVTDKALVLTGDDRQQFIEQATEYKQIGDEICRDVFTINKHALTLTIQKKNPHFNPDRDFIFVSYGTPHTVMEEFMEIFKAHKSRKQTAA